MDATLSDVGFLLIRLVLGVSFAGYGLQTLFGWLDGDGIEQTAAFYKSVGLKPSKPLAALAGVGELLAGLFFAAGLLTTLAGAAMAAIIVVAIIVAAIITVASKKAY